jgi:hypothetical protein
MLTKFSFRRNLLLLIAATLAPQAMAAKTAKAGAGGEHMIMTAPEPFNDVYTEEQFKEIAKKHKLLAGRKTAATDFKDENSILSRQFMNIRNSIIGGPKYADGKVAGKAEPIKTAAQLHTLLEDLDGKFRSGKITEPDAQLLAAQLLLLRPMRGFVARAKRIFDSSEGNARLAHAWAVTALRATAAGIDVYFPGEHAPMWQAFFDYMVEPYYATWEPNKNKDLDPKSPCADYSQWLKNNCDIRNGARYQAWLFLEVLPRLNDLHRTLKTMNLESKPIYADTKILFGDAEFESHKDRFLRLGEAERFLLLSGTQAAISAIYGLEAYHLDGFFESLDTVAKNYGFNATFQTTNATAEKRFNSIRNNHKFLFKFKSDYEDFAKANMRASYNALKTSMQNSYLAWLYLKARENDASARDNLIDPRLVAPFQRILNTGFNNAFAIVNINDSFMDVAKGDVVSAIYNGEKVTVKLKEFFINNPPKNLQNFFPTQFEGKSDRYSHLPANFEKPRDYREGNPAEWNYGVYGQYFEGVGSAKDVKRTARILSQSWGGFLLGLPIAMVMM